MFPSSAHDGSSRPAGLVDAAGGSEGPQGVHLVHEVVAVEAAVVVHNLHLEADGALGGNIHWSPDNVAHMVSDSQDTGDGRVKEFLLIYFVNECGS